MKEELLLAGDTPRDTYEVERFIGEGAFSQVYRVVHRFLGRQAMKVFRSDRTSQAEVEEILGEAALLSRIGHPNIIRVFEAGLAETRLGPRAFFTMEYVPGGNLERFWRYHDDEFVPISDSVEILTQICRGLEVAHSQDPPIIHRDIKPQNILVGYDASGIRIRIADFGLAKKADIASLMASARGTFGFKPPEVITGRDSTASDVWALGCVFYLLLTDRMPNTSAHLVSEPSESRLQPPSKFNVYVDTVLDEIVARMLALSPSDRYRTAGDVLLDLSKWSPASISPEEQRCVTDSDKALPAESDRANRDPVDLIREAERLSIQPDRLMEAADILEEALNLEPKLRTEYEYRLRLWRRGVFM